MDLPEGTTLNISAERINSILWKTGGTRYLEIGVSEGNTFFDIDASLKVAVDPAFQFDPAKHGGDGVFFYGVPSDDFFGFFETTPAAELAKDAAGDGVPRFDVIFIDGLHTFAQSYRDFVHSLRYAHDKTVWILDDTVPNDPYSALPDEDRCAKFREFAGIPSVAWHGDVYKTVVAIHDGHKDFFFRTIIDIGNPQTVLWKVPGRVCNRENLCRDLEEIDGLDYFTMAENARAMMFGSGRNLTEILHTPVTDGELQGDAVSLFFYENIKYVKMAVVLKEENSRLKRRIEIMEKAIARRS